ncbi:MAG: Xaa-Pro peptidase family protein [bacterium]|nr:Xaa-Pro peptidase family protein [bacterium]
MTSAPILLTAKTTAFLVTNLTNIRYLTGISTSYGFVLVRGRQMTLFVDDRYIEMATAKVYKNIRVRNVRALPKVMNTLKECCCEAEEVTLAQMAIWKRKYKNTKFVQTSGVIEEFRRQKSPDEVRKFLKAQSITHEIMRRIPKVLKEGITELELAEKLRSWALKLGAESLSFEPIVAFGSHSSSPHHSPTSRALKIGHIVQIDVGARYSGYCADQSEVFFTKEPTLKQLKAYEAVLRAKDAAIACVEAGATNHDLDRAATDVLAEYGMAEAFTHALGHGVGLDIHEGVSISSHSKKTELLSGEIITIEPGVYFPGSFGIRLEEEVIVR